MAIIKKIKEALSATQAEMARITGRTQPTVWRWLNGESEPTLSDIQKLRAEFHRRGIAWNDDEILGPPGEAA